MPFHDLKTDDLVASPDGRRSGTVRARLRRGVYRINWEDGSSSVELRADLLSRYTSTTPTRVVDGKRVPIIARGRIAPHVAGERERRAAA